MAGESEYYNPIIQAMQQSYGRIQQQQDLAEKTRQAKQEEAYKQQQLKQQETQFEKEHELKLREADTHAQTVKSGLELQQIEKLLNAVRATREGVNLPTDQSGNQTIPGTSMSMPQGTIPDQVTQQAAALNELKLKGGVEATNAGLKAGAVSDAELPNQLLLQKGQQTFTAGENEKTRAANALKDTNDTASRETIAKLTRASDERIAQMNNATRMAGIGDKNLTDEEMNGVRNKIATGQAKPTTNAEKKVWDNAVANGWRDPGKDIDELRKLYAIDDTLNAYEDFAKNVLPKNQLDAKIQQAKGALWNTDAKAKEAALKGKMQGVVTGLEGYTGSRQLASVYQNELQSLPSLGDTQSQAIDTKIKTLRDTRDKRRAEILKTFIPEQQLAIDKVFRLGIPPTAAAKESIWTPQGLQPVGDK